MLMRFVDQCFDELDKEDLVNFQALLTTLEDPDLQKWLTNDVKDDDILIFKYQHDKGLSDIVTKIRKANHC